MTPDIAPFRRVTRACGALAAAIGVLALVGWFTGWRSLAAIGPGFIPMAPNTALAFILQGSVLFLAGGAATNRVVARVAAVTAPLVLILALLTLAEALGLVHLRVNDLILPVRERQGDVPLGAMSPITAVTLAAAAAALFLLICVRRRGARGAAAVLALGSWGVGSAVVLGYLYRTPLFVGSHVIPVALTTGLAFVVSGAGLVASAGPDHWPLRPFFGSTVRAVLLRTFMPLAVGTLLLGGLLSAWALALEGEHNPALLTALVASLTAAALAFVVARVAARIGGTIERLERARLETQKEYSKLVELDRFKEELASLIVHDLKNPLTVVISNTDYVAAALQGRADAAPLLEALSDAQDASQRALRLLGNLLDVARLEAKTFALRRTPTNIRELVDKVMSPRAHLAGSRNITLEVDVAPGHRVEADGDLIMRVVENIVDNALRYTPAAGRIAVWSEIVGQRVRLRMGNTGTAIRPDLREHIFDKFQRGEAVSSHLNAGLGLYFCRLAAEAHGGTIWLESQAPYPTVFALELPM